MSNAIIAARVTATTGKKAKGHPNKHQTTKHPVSGKRGSPTKN